jgi:hypothetical protein
VCLKKNISEIIVLTKIIFLCQNNTKTPAKKTGINNLSRKINY